MNEEPWFFNKITKIYYSFIISLCFSSSFTGWKAHFHIENIANLDILEEKLLKANFRACSFLWFSLNIVLNIIIRKVWIFKKSETVLPLTTRRILPTLLVAVHKCVLRRAGPISHSVAKRINNHCGQSAFQFRITWSFHSWSGAWKRAPHRSPRWAGKLTLESQNSQPKIPEGLN